MKEDQIIIHTDGGARGNPGPAASAFVVEQNGSVIERGSLFLGNATNNVAEYNGVILAIQWFIKNSDKFTDIKIIFCLDSELVVRQLNGVYKVKDANLQRLHGKVNELIESAGVEILFKHVPRSENKIADQLVNEELDRNSVL